MNTAPDMFAAGLQMLAALAVVLVVILLLLKGLKKFGNQRLGSVNANRIRVLERRYMGAKKSVCLVSVPGKVLVLGVSSDRINLLDTVDPSDARDLIENEAQGTFGSMVADRLKKIGGGRKNGNEH